MRIVVADDEATTRRLLRGLLTAAGHDVLEAVDGEAAWNLLHEEGIALLITDWQMPRINGIELIRRIRSGQLPQYIYTIFLTSRDSKTDLITGLNSGADDYLIKPFHPEELRARIAIGERILTLERTLREARDAYAYQATHDPLTGLLNRLAITDHVRAELARTQRTRTPISLALLDIDHFKRVNDVHGHLVGDQALMHVAQILSHTVRPYDWIGRWGGEEFLIILANTTLDEAIGITERLRSQIAATPLVYAPQGVLALTASIGVACATAPIAQDLDPIMLFQQTDAALYAAKNAGRNCVRWHTEPFGTPPDAPAAE